MPLQWRATPPKCDRLVRSIAAHLHHAIRATSHPKPTPIKRNVTITKPQIIRTDSGRVAAQQRDTHRRTPCGCNEGMFRSPAFGKALEQLGIRHQRTDPGCPWQNGRIERLFGTLKQVLDCWIVSGIEQLNRDLDSFRHWYNHIRPHQNLNGRTPAEAWNGIDPYAKPARQEHWFEAWDGLLSGYHLRY